MNYASALLAASQGAGSNGGDKKPSVASVGDDAIRTEPRGPLLGIPGAPNVLPRLRPRSSGRSGRCARTPASNTALPPGSKPTLQTTADPRRAPPGVRPAGRDTAMLVSADGGRTTYLLWTGGRSLISLDRQHDPARVRPVRQSATTSDQRRAAQRHPAEQGHRTAGRARRRRHNRATPSSSACTSGDVFGLEHADRSTSIFVALQHGVQPVSPLVGDLIRDQFNESRQLPLVSPKLLRAAPRAGHIDLSIYPRVRPSIIDYTGPPRHLRVPRRDRAQHHPDLRRRPRSAAGRGQAGHRDQAGPAGRRPGVRPAGPAVRCSPRRRRSRRAGLHGLYVVSDDGVSYPVVGGAALVALGLHGQGHRVDRAGAAQPAAVRPGARPDAGGALLPADRAPPRNRYRRRRSGASPAG